MAKTESTMLALGTVAAEFALPDTAGNTVTLADFKTAKGLLIMFICNHCPYVVHVREALVKVSRWLLDQDIAVVAINSNDATAYPEDSPQRMAEDKERYQYPFPYLFDETQSVARAYKAACTPDFFLFDQDRRLFYRGQMDGSRPGNDVKPSGSALVSATQAMLSGRPVPSDQKPSLGCNIKWKPVSLC